MACLVALVLAARVVGFVVVPLVVRLVRVVVLILRCYPGAVVGNGTVGLAWYFRKKIQAITDKVATAVPVVGCPGSDEVGDWESAW
ncbi:hypothetical protein VTK26DRAFT_4325 [Humicola hyalothermophila]